MSFSISKTLSSYQKLTWSNVPLGGYIFFNQDLYRKMDFTGDLEISRHRLVAFSGNTKFEEEKVIDPFSMEEPCFTFSPSKLHLEVSSVKNPSQLSCIQKGMIGFGKFQEESDEWVICLQNKSGTRILVKLETGEYRARLDDQNEHKWIGGIIENRDAGLKLGQCLRCI